VHIYIQHLFRLCKPPLVRTTLKNRAFSSLKNFCPPL